MKRLAEELKNVAESLKPHLVITIKRDDKVDGSAYNAICAEAQRFVDTVRRNEEMATVMLRTDADDAVELRFGFTDHDAIEAIEKELVKKVSNTAAKYGIKDVETKTEEGCEMEAAKVAKIANRIVAGGDVRTIKGQGWTEQEALDDAMRKDKDEHGYEYGSMREVFHTKMLKAPQKAKKVTVEKKVVKKGPVEKKFIIERRWGFDRSSPIDRDRRFTQKYDGQGEVLKVAKELALEYGEVLTISLQAFVQGNTQLAIVTPEQSQRGEWAFEAEFR